MKQPSLARKAAELCRSRSPMREIMDFANRGFCREIGIDHKEVISFAGGWVDHEAPGEMQQVYREIIENPELFHRTGGYSPTLGFPECRQAVVDFERLVHGVSALSPSNVAIGANSTQLTHTLLSVLLESGDAIMLMDPSYCNFPMQILTGVECHVQRFPVIDPDAWRPIADERIDDLKKAILSDRPKVILLIAPDNPTSQVLSQAFVEAALAAAQEIGAFLVVDFSYKEIVFGSKKPDYFSWGPSDHFISIHSNSKWCRGLGRRLGWVEAPEVVVQALETPQCASILCPDSLHQMVFSRYVEETAGSGSLRRYLDHVTEQYQAAALQTCRAIREHLGTPCFEPQGGIYTCFRVRGDGAAFVEKAIKTAGVLLVPGWGFGRTMQNAIRVSYGPLVCNLERIEVGFERLGEVMRHEI